MKLHRVSSVLSESAERKKELVRPLNLPSQSHHRILILTAWFGGPVLVKSEIGTSRYPTDSLPLAF
jgi:hypothetical protein